MKSKKLPGINEQLFTVYIRGNPAYRPLVAPMSHHGRAILFSVLDFASRHSLAVGLRLDQVITRFVSEYDPLIYERASTQAAYDAIHKRINAMKKPSDMDAFMVRMSLQDVFEGADFEIPHGAQIGDTPELRAAYGFLTTNFLVGDFPRDHLHRIALMAQQTPLAAIQEAAGRIADVTKRTIPYLWAILEGRRQNSEAQQRGLDAAHERSSKVISHLSKMSQHSPKFTPSAGSVEDLVTQMREEREMQEAAAALETT